jgi:hypothetical protein
VDEFKIREPVTGLYKKDYAVDVKHMKQDNDADLLGIALLLQTWKKRFFQDASAKIPSPRSHGSSGKSVKRKRRTREGCRA